MAIDAHLDDVDLDNVRFGRNRALRLLGAGLFGLATQWALRAEPASARHQGPPPPCFGFQRCHHCFYESCSQYCSWYPHSHCPSGVQCWHGCYSHTLYRCCDWHERFPGGTTHHCLCRGSIGLC